jgi:hypothetical protein
MCEILKFPVKKEIPKELEEQLYAVAKDYVTTLNKVFDAYIDDIDDPEAIEVFFSKAMMVYTKAVVDAVEELDLDSD